MPKSSLIERMEKKDAPKTWITEIYGLLALIKEKNRLIEEYGEVIDTLARQVEDLTPDPCESCCHEEPDACDYCSEDKRD